LEEKKGFFKKMGQTVGAGGERNTKRFDDWVSIQKKKVKPKDKRPRGREKGMGEPGRESVRPKVGR